MGPEDTLGAAAARHRMGFSSTMTCRWCCHWEPYWAVCNGIPLLSKCASSRAVAGACVAARHDLPLLALEKAKEDDQWPGQPRPSLRSASGLRSTGTCRLSSDPAEVAHP